MDKFTKLTATACPINQANLNTDQILPARYLKWTRAMGMARCCSRICASTRTATRSRTFRSTSLPGAMQDCVGARNFGCGSSREAAVYALYDYGVRCVIAPSFGDIFSATRAERPGHSDRHRRRSRGDHGDADRTRTAGR